MTDKVDLVAKSRHLSHILTGIATAPEGADMSAFSAYLSDNKLSEKEQTALLKRGCTDAGAVLNCLRPAKGKKKAPAKKAAKKAAKKSA